MCSYQDRYRRAHVTGQTPCQQVPDGIIVLGQHRLETHYYVSTLILVDNRFENMARGIATDAIAVGEAGEHLNPVRTSIDVDSDGMAGMCFRQFEEGGKRAYEIDKR